MLTIHSLEKNTWRSDLQGRKRCWIAFQSILYSINPNANNLHCNSKIKHMNLHKKVYTTTIKEYCRLILNMISKFWPQQQIRISHQLKNKGESVQLTRLLHQWKALDLPCFQPVAYGEIMLDWTKEKISGLTLIFPLGL